jgi:hypothetical protein
LIGDFGVQGKSSVGIHDGFVGRIADQGERLLRRIDELKRLLAFVQLTDEDLHKGWPSAARDARSLAIICSMAELEALTAFLIKGTHSELNGCTLITRDIRPCVRQLAAHRAFESLKTLEDHSKLWQQRAYTTTLDQNAEFLELPISAKGPQPPLDGRTLRPEHYYRIWAIYGLPGDAFPSVSWAASLQKLALLRNDLAHGNLPFAEIFQQAGVTVPEVENYIDDLAEFSIHLISAWSQYLELRLYLKSGDSTISVVQN